MAYGDVDIGIVVHCADAGSPSESALAELADWVTARSRLADETLAR